MSQHWFTNKQNRKVLYGSDKPTGGFFFTEFYNDDELSCESSQDVVFTKSSLTIHEFIRDMDSGYDKWFTTYEIAELLMDWAREKNPTPLQQNISKMFGKNLPEMISRVEIDIFDFMHE